MTKAEERLSLAEQDAMVKQTKRLFPGAEIVSVTDMDSGFGADDTLYDDTPDTEI